MPNRLLTRDEVYVEIDALFERMGLKPPQRAVSDGETIGARIEPPVVSWPVRAACDHCWHLPRDWQQGSLTVPVPRLCCWCGGREEPQHGPYAPGGAHG
jgi:hypothetical protein